MEDMESIRSQSGKGAAVSCLCPDNRTEADCAGPDGLNRFNTVGSKLSTYRKEVAGESGDLEVIEKHSSKSCLTPQPAYYGRIQDAFRIALQPLAREISYTQARLIYDYNPTFLHCFFEMTERTS
jgi:hypothetical protein